MAFARLVFTVFLEIFWAAITIALSVVSFGLLALAIVQPVAIIVLVIVCAIYYFFLSIWARRTNPFANAGLLLGLHALVFIFGLLFTAMLGLEPTLLWIASGF